MTKLRKVARDAYVSRQGSRYSLPRTYAGKWVRNRASDVEVHYDREHVVVHGQAPHKHSVITQPEHHRGTHWAPEVIANPGAHSGQSAGGGDPSAGGV